MLSKTTKDINLVLTGPFYIHSAKRLVISSVGPKPIKVRIQIRIQPLREHRRIFPKGFHESAIFSLQRPRSTITKLMKLPLQIVILLLQTPYRMFLKGFHAYFSIFIPQKPRQTPTIVKKYPWQYSQEPLRKPYQMFPKGF